MKNILVVWTIDESSDWEDTFVHSYIGPMSSSQLDRFLCDMQSKTDEYNFPRNYHRPSKLWDLYQNSKLENCNPTHVLSIKSEYFRIYEENIQAIKDDYPNGEEMYHYIGKIIPLNGINNREISD